MECYPFQKIIFYMGFINYQRGDEISPLWYYTNNLKGPIRSNPIGPSIIYLVAVFCLREKYRLINPTASIPAPNKIKLNVFVAVFGNWLS